MKPEVGPAKRLDLKAKKVDVSGKLEGRQLIRIIDYDADDKNCEVTIHQGDKGGAVLWSHKGQGHCRAYGVGIDSDGVYVDVKGKVKLTLWPR